MSEPDQIDKSSTLDALFGNASHETKSESSLDSLFCNNPPSSGKPHSNESNSLDALFGKSAPSSSDASANPLQDTKESHSDSSALDALFSASTNDVHFCRDCRYFIPHPYHCRCALTENVVSPTDDCPSYAKPLVPQK